MSKSLGNAGFITFTVEEHVDIKIDDCVMLIDTQRVDKRLDPGFFLHLSTVVVLKALLQQPFEVWQPPQVRSGDRHKLVLTHSPPDLGGGDAPHKQPGGLPHYPDVGQGTWPGPRPCCWWALARLGPGTAAQSKYGWPWELPRPASHPRSRRRSRRRWRRYPGPTRPGSHRYIWLNSAGRHTSCLLTQREGGRLDKCLSNRSSSRSRSRSRSWRVSPEEIISGEIIDWSGDYL